MSWDVFMLAANLSAGVIATIIVLAIFLVTLIVVFLVMVPTKLWAQALVSGAHVSMSKLIGMKFRHVKPRDIVLPYIKARKAGIVMSVDELETHMLAGGNVERLVAALIAAHSADIDLPLQMAKAIDLSGRDLLDIIKTCVIPKMIETPPISSVARDGIELIVKARITVKSNIHRVMGGANEDTVIARVGEGIVTTVGSAARYQDVLENPDLISQRLLQRGLDAATSFEIISIDIFDVDVGENMGASLQAKQAETQSKIGRAAAEARRAEAVALEQEMKAKTQEMKAYVIEAEAEVPKALAKALSSGRLSAMDYYNLENLKSDTTMRNNIAGSDKKDIDDDF